MQAVIEAFWAELLKYLPGIMSALALAAGVVFRAWLQTRMATTAVDHVIAAPEIDTDNDVKLVRAARKRMSQTMHPLIAPLSERGAMNLTQRVVKHVAKRDSVLPPPPKDQTT